jgi:hypothetical protein
LFELAHIISNDGNSFAGLFVFEILSLGSQFISHNGTVGAATMLAVVVSNVVFWSSAINEC